MAIRRQNKALTAFFIIVILALLLVLFRNEKLKMPSIEDKEINIKEYIQAQDLSDDQDPSVNQEAAADSGSTENEELKLEREARAAYAQILTDLGDCLTLKGGAENVEKPIKIDTLIERYQTELGLPILRRDRSITWYLRDDQGVERRLRLENRPLTGGGFKKVVTYYTVDPSGDEVPYDPNPASPLTGTTEEISEILNSGEVFYKEEMAMIRFSGGQEVLFVKKNDELSEFEFIVGDKFFRCDNIKARENCHCL